MILELGIQNIKHYELMILSSSVYQNLMRSNVQHPFKILIKIFNRAKDIKLNTQNIKAKRTDDPIIQYILISTLMWFVEVLEESG